MPEPQIIRQWSILRILGARKYGTSVYELAQEMAVGEKTIRRDLISLQSLGFPLNEKSVDHGKKLWTVSHLTGLPNLTLNMEEVLSLYIGQRLMEPLAGTMFWGGAVSSYRKIRSSLSDGAIEYLDRLASLLHFSSTGTKNYKERAELIDRLMIAIEDRKITDLVYQSMQATESVSRQVHPLGLSYFRGSLYLIAKAAEDDAIKHYKVDRIEGAELMELKFVRPANFDLQQWMASSFGVFRSDKAPQHFVIRFSHEVARYVSEATWHPSQKLTAQKDGSLLAEFDLPDHQEIGRWIRSFGSAATVIEPQALVEEIRADIKQMQAAYNMPSRRTE